MMFAHRIQRHPTGSLGAEGVHDLWVAFLRRMISDATLRPTASHGDRAFIMSSARDWLTEPRFRRDREWVAMAIGVEISVIDRFVHALEAGGWNRGSVQFPPSVREGDPCL